MKRGFERRQLELNQSNRILVNVTGEAAKYDFGSILRIEYSGDDLFDAESAVNSVLLRRKYRS